LFTSIVYFLLSGSINYILEKYNIVYSNVPEGDYFGDYEVINNMLRVHTTIAKTECRMMILSKDVTY
jgi:CRP-like cAMP-binding protein